MRWLACSNVIKLAVDKDGLTNIVLNETWIDDIIMSKSITNSESYVVWYCRKFDIVEDKTDPWLRIDS